MNSRAKGQRGERDWAATLRNLGFPDARRGVQYQGAPGSPDVVGGIPGTHCEVKRTEKLRIYKAMNQAEAETGPGEIPYVAHRKNNTDWLVTVPVSFLIDFCRVVTAADRLAAKEEA